MKVIISDSGSEIKNIIMYLWKKYKIKYIRISTYNSKVNRFIKIGHKLII